jgi:hypothetical protein
VGIVSLVLAGFLAGGVYAFHRQGKPLAVQLLLAAAVVGLVLLAFSIGFELS